MKSQMGNNQAHFDDEELGKYCLGALQEPRRTEVEEALFTDPLIEERIDGLEEQATMDYLSGGLSTDDRRQFELQLSTDSELRNRVAGLRRVRAAMDPWRALTLEKQDEIYRKLMIFFCKRRAREPEELAQDAIARICTSLKNGAVLTADVTNFAYGFAANVLAEHRKAHQFINLDDHLEAHGQKSVTTPKIDEMTLLEQLLQGLSPADRACLEKYYLEDARGRKEFARDLGIDISTLRVRALRLRRQLKELAEREPDRNGRRP